MGQCWSIVGASANYRTDFFFPLALFRSFICLTLLLILFSQKSSVGRRVTEEDTHMYWRGPVSQGFVLQPWWDRCLCGHCRSGFSCIKEIVLETVCENTAG